MTRSEPFILWLEDCDASSAAVVGGKCAGLGEMTKAGFAVPPGFAVTTGAHEVFLSQGGLEQSLSSVLASIDPDDVGSVQASSRNLRELVEAAALPEAVERAIRSAYQELGERCETDGVPVAVRSSAVAEDLATASFAGQLETYLWVRGADEVVRHTVRAWSGLFTAAALAYRHERGLGSGRALMAVGVQRMAEPRAAGVMFTLNPLNGDRSKIAIEASFGLGEAVVSGEVDPDRYLVDKVTLELVERAIGNKQVEHRFDPEQGCVVAVPVAEERRGAACLADAEVLELAALGKRIERYHGAARDVEWALCEDTDGPSIQVLQSRAETVWSQKQPERPVMEPKSSAVEYVLAELLGSGGGGAKASGP
jgi:pyruvate,water dikinase